MHGSEQDDEYVFVTIAGNFGETENMKAQAQDQQQSQDETGWSDQRRSLRTDTQDNAS